MSAYEQLFRQLDEVGTLSRGRSKHRPRNDPILYGGPHPFIQTGDVKHSSFYVTSYSQTYSDKGLAQSKLWPPGTLCITIAANIADTAILTFPACFPDSIIGFKAKDGVSSTAYVKYCLDTYKTQMRSISQGTTQDNLSQGKLLSLKFRIPDFQTQQKIAAVLSAYDDLIANNQRRITLLERMAEDIYREWFVRLRFPGHRSVKTEKGIPHGWQAIVFAKICKFEKGKNPADLFDTPVDGSLPYLNVETLENAGISYAVQTKNSVVANDEDILMLMDGARSGFTFRGKAGIVSSTFALVRTDLSLRNIVFEYLKAGRDAIVFNNTGSAIPHANKEFVNRMTLFLPTDKVLIEKFNVQYQSIFDQIQIFVRQNRLLVQTRDSLLPRLISGKLAADALDIHFPPK